MSLLLVRHGPTAWNRAGRLQGRADVPLDAAGEAVIADWTLPPEFRDASLLSSPLRRATRTAELLVGVTPTIRPDLVELDWGDWEGESLGAIRDADADDLARREALGLDFRPPGGESYREVQARASGLVHSAIDPVVAVTHRGVMLALLAWATGWDMIAPPPLVLGRSDALEIAGAGRRVRAIPLA